ncbi:MAG: ABC transporter permease [Anaerolineae bacterium]|nr:ABC transporter permease [Anaerolineae bacterium]
MRNVRLVIKHEIVSTLSKPSFWIMTFLFPVLIVGLNIGVQITSERAFEREADLARSDTSQVIGYVDPGGIIARIPDRVPAGMLRAFPTQAAAHDALTTGEIARYYLVPADWIESGDLTLVDSTYKPLGAVVGGEMFRYVLSYNLVGDDDVADRLLDPTPRVSAARLAPQEGGVGDGPLSFWVSYATMFILFLSLTMSSGFVLQSVAKEKESRTAEVLLLSLRPRELMLGKLVGLGLIALAQLLVWAGGGILFLDRGGAILQMVSTFALPRGFLAWVVLYFLFGYAAYASVLGAIGVLAPSAREGAQFTFVVMLPLMIPLFLNYAFAEDPHGTLATALSLLPPTAPLSMVTRLAVGGVPLWQPILSLAGLAGMAYLFVLLAARFFRAGNLLSSASLNWSRVLSELRRQPHPEGLD